jgi:hypothetical protein
MAANKFSGDIAVRPFSDGPALPRTQCISGGETLFAIASFLCPLDNLPEDFPLCITDIAPWMRSLARMASVCHAWKVFVHQNIGRFNQILRRLETHPPPRSTMDGGYRLYRFVASKINKFPAQPREFLQILGTVSASAEGLMDYIKISKVNDPSHWMALPATEGHILKLKRHRDIALHLIGSHVIDDDHAGSFCTEVTRRLEERDHSAFDPSLCPINIIRRRIVGYLTLHREARRLRLDQVPLLSSNHFYWNRTLVKALTPEGRADILHVLLLDQITAARDAGLDE